MIAYRTYRKRHQEPATRTDPAQSRVLLGVCDGKLNKQIAHELSITEATVKAHVTAVLRKFGAHHRTQLLAMTQALAVE